MRGGKKILTGMLAAVMLLGGTCFVSAADGTWIKDNNGWWYQNPDSTYPRSTWMQDKSGEWYHFNAAGYMQTGWILVDGTWYYMNPVSDGTKGAMKTGWVQVENKWYYLDETNGDMASGKWITDGSTMYYIGADGVWTGASNQAMVSSTSRRPNKNNSNDNNDNNNDNTTTIIPDSGLTNTDFGTGVTVKTEGNTSTITNQAGDNIVIKVEEGNQTPTVTITVTGEMKEETVKKVASAENSVKDKLDQVSTATVADNKTAAVESVTANEEVKVAVVLSNVASDSASSKAQTVTVVAQEGTSGKEVQETAQTVADSIIDTAEDSNASVVYKDKPYSKEEAKGILSANIASSTVTEGERVVYILVNGEYVEYTIDIETIQLQ